MTSAACPCAAPIIDKAATTALIPILLMIVSWFFWNCSCCLVLRVAYCGTAWSHSARCGHSHSGRRSLVAAFFLLYQFLHHPGHAGRCGIDPQHDALGVRIAFLFFLNAFE